MSITKYPTLKSNLSPADLNGDGRPDLVAGTGDSEARNGDLVVRLGVGDGTFGPDRVVASAMSPVTVGDFNADSHTDIVAVGPEQDSGAELFILGGRGDGTFLPPVTIPGGVGQGFAFNGMTADFNADGHRDLAVMGMESDAVRIFPGNGDLTFGPHASLATAAFSRQFIVAHLNADTRADIAVATQYGWGVDVFLNNGGLLFTRTSIPFDRGAMGITARDMNGDGKGDLIVTTGEEGLFGAFSSGEVNVLLGRGDGTFDAPMTFPAANGPMAAVAGDFNRDGIVDVATGNITEVYDSACDSYAFLPDSVSILPGLGDGHLGPPATFALGGYGRSVPPEPYRQSHHALKTSDLDGDGQTDLIASLGAILLNVPPAANRPPVVDAGEDRQNVPPSPGPGGTSLIGSATDPDDDWLTWEWRDQAGKVLGRLPRTCFFDEYHGEQTFTLTVTDGRGGVATDIVTYTFGSPLPEGWASQDVGAVAASGSAEFDGTTFRVTGSGADIWGTADEFHFAHQTWTGDFDFTALVTSVQHVHQWTKAGLMIRAANEPGSAHASVFATPTTEKGIAFQRRMTEGGTSVHTAGPALAPPVWLRLSRRGTTITGSYRMSATDAWTDIASDSIPLPQSVQLGLAVTSHQDGTLATATFDNVTVAAPDSSPLPEGWSSQDIGAVGAAGTATHAHGVFTVKGSGADIWGTADEFHFVSRQVSLGEQNLELTARVTSVENVHRWTKVGIMVRDHMGASSPHAMVVVTPTTEKGVAFQRRPDEGGQSVHTDGPSITAPVWLKLVVAGHAVRAYYRKAATDSWTFIGEQRRSFAPSTVEVGFVVSSHVDGTLATATFDNVSVYYQQFDLDSRDIGAVAIAGALRREGDLIFEIDGSGADIWGTADAFHFVSDSAIDSFRVGERGRISARVLSVENTHRWAKAGVMIRESYAPDSPHVMVVVTPGKGIAMQYRGGSGTISSSFTPLPGAAPAWVRLTRDGTTFIGEASLDGVTWQQVGRVEVLMTPKEQFGATLAGLAVTSHNNTTLATAVFDDVRWEPF